MAVVELRMTIHWPWWRRPFMAAVVIAALLRLPVDLAKASAFLTRHARFEAR